MLGKDYIEVPIKMTQINPLYGRYSLEIGFVIRIQGYYELYKVD